MDFVVMNSNSLQMNSNSTPNRSKGLSVYTVASENQQVAWNILSAAHWGIFAPTNGAKRCDRLKEAA